MKFSLISWFFGGSSNKECADTIRRHLVFQRALFLSDSPQDVEIQVFLELSPQGTEIHIEGSGNWTGSYNRNDAGAETFEFETTAASERITVSSTGEALWELDYFDTEKKEDHVIAFAGIRIEN